MGCLGTHIWVPTDSSCLSSEVREGRGLTTPKNNCPACLKSRQRSCLCVRGGDPRIPACSVDLSLYCCTGGVPDMTFQSCWWWFCTPLDYGANLEPTTSWR